MSETVLAPAKVEPASRATAPMITALPGAPASLKAALLACLNLRKGSLEIRLPQGQSLRFGGVEPGPDACLIVIDPRFARRVLFSGDIGFAEGYMAGEWDTPDLSALLEMFSRNLDAVVRLLRGNPVAQGANLLRHFTRDNTRTGARRNILSHYDLGNRFYAAWLDPTMTYSSARFESGKEDLTAAQINKYRGIAENLRLQPGDRVLEIGCGWGGFAEFAARDYGAHVTGLTISDAQCAYARERMRRLGLSDRTEILLKDYRDVDQQFDKVASIEMFEAVGERHWPIYFAKVADVLKPGGRAALQIITIKDDLFPSYRKRADFIQRYIFPGGMLPSITRLKEETARAGLQWDRMQAFGMSYAETLAEWGARFVSRWDEIRTLGFDERFKRLWRFYLSYCEAGFRTARTDVVQVALEKA
jgi:cyclopropane-fatty-acyl-phospholipid synthase